jgi:hypothetical protein
VPPGEERLARYDPILHAVDFLANTDGLVRGRDRLRAAAPDADGTFLVLVADVSRTDAAYESAVSLVWRDAGALLATLHLTATAMALGFCFLGLLGHDIVASISDAPTLLAVGAAVVGEAC